jgi:signal transduction histidine kinase
VEVVRDAAPALTKLSFRRDIRVFLTALGGFFAILVAVLLMLVNGAVTKARGATMSQWNVIADAAAGDIAAAVASGHASNSGVILTTYAARYDVTGSDARLASGERFTTRAPLGGTTLTRRGPWGTLQLTFDDTPLTALSQYVSRTAAITGAAAAGAIVLLLLYIPRILRPIEQLLDQASEVEERHPAVDEQSYLLDTFRKTVATLKEQKEELRLLHDAQKSRADDLDRVTAALTRGMTSGMLAIDPAGTVIEINQAGREILGLSGSDPFRSGSIESVLGDAPFAHLVREALEQRAPLTRRETDAAGNVVIGVTTVPLNDDDGNFLGLIVLFTDLTSIRRLETRLRESQTLADLGEMSAGIAHEFRNSLSTILGYLKLAQRSDEAQAILPKVRKAEEEAVLLTAAVESLLAFAKPVKLERQRVELRPLIEQLAGRIEATAPRTTVSIRGEATVDADAALLARAIQNVLRNAVDAIAARDAGGHIDIELDPERRTVVIRDDGIGFRQEDAARFFLPFHSDKAGGFGLGLPLAKKIVVQHGGTISMTGEPGNGATVTIDLDPAGAAETAAVASAVLH